MLAWSAMDELRTLQDVAPAGVKGPLERLEVDLRRDGETVGHLFRDADADDEVDEGVKMERDESGGADEEWWEDWLYHWILVNTRSFHWKPEGVRVGSMVMCPFLDYMNHCPNGLGVSLLRGISSWCLC